MGKRVKELIRNEFFIMLQSPFRTYYYGESLIIRDIIAAISVISIFLARTNTEDEVSEGETLKTDNKI